MIISKTPFRVSFVGGGSDLKAYYENKPGAVTSTTINKHMYVTVNKRFSESIRVSYTETEIVDLVEKVKHDLVREALKKVNLDGGLEITTIADIPAGTGLGSSSSLTVGLLNALYAYKGQYTSAEKLAKEACEIEIDVLGKPIGEQDQYAAAYGGLNHIQFNPDETVSVDPVICKKETKEKLDNRLCLFYTGLTRDSEEILDEQKERTTNEKEKQKTLSKMVKLSEEIQKVLANNDLTEFGQILHKGWQLKRKMASKITNSKIDEWYEVALDAGAVGGKLLGAGGGGFLLLYCREENQGKLKEAMEKKGLKKTTFHLEPQGSKIIYVEEPT